MGRWSSLVVYFLVGVPLIAGGHYYLWSRLIRNVGFTLPTERALTALLCGLAVSIPIAVVTSRLVPPDWSRWWVTPVYLWIGVACLLVLCVGAVDVLRTGYTFATSGLGRPDADRRQALARLAAISAAAVGLLVSGWAALEGRKVHVKRVEVPLKKLSRAFDGLRIVQLSDVHVGPTIGREFIEHVVATVNGLSPDVVAITGDLVDASVEDLEHHVAPLARLASTYGTFFVTGNHEYHAGAPEWCEHLGTLGMRVLRNERVALERHGSVLQLAGIDDYESANFRVGHRADLPKAVAGRDPKLPLILLAHQPRAVHEAVQHGVDLQLSGHTHGGQLWPMGLLQRLGQPLVAGLARFGETFLYVSCGTGHSGPPMRFAAPAEITHIVLRAG
jgi:uncharacterized protein